MPDKSLYLWTAYPSPPARRLLLHLCTLSCGQFTQPIGFVPYSKPGVVVQWIRCGRGRMVLDDVEWQLEPDSCFWVYGTNQPRYFIPEPGQVLGAQSFRFSGPGLEDWLEELDAKRRPKFSLPCPKRIFEGNKTMVDLVRRRPPDWELKAHLELSSVMWEFLRERHASTSQPGKMPEAITQVLDAVESDPERHWMAPDLAAIAGMSYTAFRILFKATVDESPHDYLQRLRMDLARRMLADSTRLIKEIAFRLHFASVHYFSSFFHTHAGISPTEFRRFLVKSQALLAEPTTGTPASAAPPRAKRRKPRSG